LIGQKDIFLFIRRSQTDYVCIGLKKLEMAARGLLEKLGDCIDCSYIEAAAS
jgi:hypothetical protein